MSHHHQPPANITSARRARSADIHRREIRYLWSMGIRTICFIFAVIAIVSLGWTLFGWILIAAAVILPYVSVVLANAANTRVTQGKLGVPPDSHHQISGSEQDGQKQDGNGNP